MAQKQVKRRIAVVTGASKGLGLETARGLAAKGLHVILTARTGKAAAQGLAALGSEAEARPLDPADDGSVAAFFDWLLGTHGRIDVLVNNAGRLYDGYGGGLESADAKTILEAIDNNALSALRTIRRALPLMNEAGYGRIVNISSGMGQLSDMGGGALAYRLSKVAMNAITRIAHAEAKGDVKVNSVCPGWVRTDMGGASAPLSVEEGAAGILWAATLPKSGPSGGFFRHGKRIEW